MTSHNKITFAKEYCLCRKIPYKFKGEQLTIGMYDGTYGSAITIYSVYNLTYADLIKCIDDNVDYDPVTTNFVKMKLKRSY